MEQIGPPRDGLDHRNVARPGEGRQLRRRLGILNAAAGDDERPLGAKKQMRRVGDVARIGRRTSDAMRTLFKKLHGIVVGPSLNVLRQAEERGTAIGGVEQGRYRLRQRLEDLRGMGDPVPEACHRLEGIVDADCGVAEMLDLLQYRIGQARDVAVAAQQQHRQAVGVRDRRGGQHVCRARPGGGRREQEALAQLLPCVRDSGHRHRLFVLAAPQRQGVPLRVESLAQTEHIAVSEDPEAAAANPFAPGVGLDILSGEVSDERLGHRQADAARRFFHGLAGPSLDAPV